MMAHEKEQEKEMRKLYEKQEYELIQFKMQQEKMIQHSDNETAIEKGMVDDMLKKQQEQNEYLKELMNADKSDTVSGGVVSEEDNEAVIEDLLQKQQ